jgi:hypothetical protein
MEVPVAHPSDVSRKQPGRPQYASRFDGTIQVPIDYTNAVGTVGTAVLLQAAKNGLIVLLLAGTDATLAQFNDAIDRALRCHKAILVVIVDDPATESRGSSAFPAAREIL